jgi:hypothetical protein
VRERRKARAAVYNNQCPDIRPRLKYLFSGLLQCNVCGASYVIADRYNYACSSHVNGGQHACSNNLRVPRKLVEDKLLEGIRKKLFDAEAIERLRKRIVEMQAERQNAHRPDQARARQELAQVEKEIANLITAVKAGTFSPTLKTALEKAEAEHERLLGLLKVDTRAADKVVQLIPDLVNRYKALVDDLVRVSQRDISRARTQIKPYSMVRFCCDPPSRVTLRLKCTAITPD